MSNRQLQVLTVLSQFLVHLTTGAFHMCFPEYSPFVSQVADYGLTKGVGTWTMQILAQNVSADTMQVISVHPGVIDTAMTSLTEEQKAYMRSVGALDSHELPADFFVWLSNRHFKSVPQT